jgi:hypothetical protein
MGGGTSKSFDVDKDQLLRTKYNIRNFGYVWYTGLSEQQYATGFTSLTYKECKGGPVAGAGFVHCLSEEKFYDDNSNSFYFNKNEFSEKIYSKGVQLAQWSSNCVPRHISVP